MISPIRGRAERGEYVVAIDGEAAKKEYRHLPLKTVEGANDFASMYEVITRRLTRATQEREALAKEGKLPADGKGLSGFADLPDLILIDGGPQQLRFAREAMLKAGYNIPMFGLAKQLEEIFLPNQEESILLDRKSPALHLIQRIRDEAPPLRHHPSPRSAPEGGHAFDAGGYPRHRRDAPPCAADAF